MNASTSSAVPAKSTPVPAAGATSPQPAPVPLSTDDLQQVAGGGRAPATNW